MVTRFPWKETYKIGIREIDDQHKRFIELIEQAEALFSCKDLTQAEIIEVATQLGDYAFWHFETEEKYFKEFGYPLATEHEAVHDAFRKRVMKFVETARNPGVNLRDLSLEIASFANDWLVNHILTEDARYVQCFKEHGL